MCHRTPSLQERDTAPGCEGQEWALPGAEMQEHPWVSAATWGGWRAWGMPNRLGIRRFSDGCVLSNPAEPWAVCGARAVLAES